MCEGELGVQNPKLESLEGCNRKSTAQQTIT